MDLKTLLRIQIITLSDSICYGLIYGFINPYLLIVGGNHFIIGIFTVLNFVCQLLSADVVKLVKSQSGKQFALFIVSVAAAISYLLITLTSYWWFIVFARCIFTIKNQTNGLCRDILLKKIPKNETEYFLTVHNVLSGCGLIIGPIITGCLFDFGFSYSCFLATALSLGNVWLSTTLLIEDADDDENYDQEKSLMEKKTEELQEVFENFKSSNLKDNWDVISLKFLFTSSSSIFFSKFTQILQNNFHAKAADIGITAAYMNALFFACPYVVDNIREKVELKEFSLINHSLCTLLISLILACYAPAYSFYLFICIPLILSRCYLNKIWSSLFASRKNQALNRINNAVGIAPSFVVPVLFGVICDQIGVHAVVLFSVVPIIFSLFIFYKRTFPEILAYHDNENGVKNKDE